MQYPKFAETVKQLRAYREKTVYEVAEAVGVSHTYISQMENGKKLPSKKVLFPLAHFLGSRNDRSYYEKMEGIANNENKIVLPAKSENPSEYKLFSIYGEYKNISEDEILKEYTEYIAGLVIDFSNSIQNDLIARKENKIKLDKGMGKITKIEKPYFDLKWLLTQKEYEVFYGRNHDIQGIMEGQKEVEEGILIYNVLTEQDIKTIREIIETYISNKYPKITEQYLTKKEGD